MRSARIRRVIRRYAVRLPRRLTNEIRDRAGLCTRVIVYGTPFKRRPPSPEPGTRVLEVSVGGVFHVPIPDGIAEGGDRWDAWIDDALTAAQEDGRWANCTEIEDMRSGVLGPRGYVLSPAEQSDDTDAPRSGDADQ